MPRPATPATESSSRPHITVLLSLAPPDGTTRYVVQLIEGVPPEVTLLFFSWWTALFGRFDVFHVHWPEYLVRGRNPLVRFARSLLFSTLLLRLHLGRKPIVRTAHNLFPHESGGRLEQFLLRACDKQTSLFIRLNRATEMGERENVVTILHGHYKDRFNHHHLPPRIAGRLLYFGLIRPYKGVEDLLAVFLQMTDKGLSLRIVGKPLGDLGPLVADACRKEPRVTARLEFVADDVLVHEIGQAELVILPYKEMQNSGSLLVALSLGRPVLAPASPSNALIADEVGANWLFTYEGSLTREIIEDALMRSRSSFKGASPDLSGRDWAVVGGAHYRAYQQAVATSCRKGRNSN